MLVPVNSLVHPNGAILQVIVPVAAESPVVNGKVKVVVVGTLAIVNSSLKIDSFAPEILMMSYRLYPCAVEVVTVAMLLDTVMLDMFLLL